MSNLTLPYNRIAIIVFAVLVLLYRRFVSPLVNMGSLLLALTLVLPVQAQPAAGRSKAPVTVNFVNADVEAERAFVVWHRAVAVAKQMPCAEV